MSRGKKLGYQLPGGSKICTEFSDTLFEAMVKSS